MKKIIVPIDFSGDSVNALEHAIVIANKFKADVRMIHVKGKRSKTKHATEIGIVKSQLKKRWIGFEETFGYETKYKRECILNLPKNHINDAIAICCEDKQIKLNNDNVYLKKHVSSGDYQQTKGKHSEIKISTGKLFGLRKFDLIKTSKGIGFVKGKRVRGVFVIFRLNDTKIIEVGIKRKCKRILARKTTLIEKSECTV